MAAAPQPRTAWPLRLVVQGLPMSPNDRRRSHWSAQHRDTALFRDAVAWQSRQLYAGPPLERAKVHVTLIHRTKHRYDPDGSFGVVKPLLDGLAIRGGGTLLVDDRGISLTVNQSQGLERSVVVEIMPLEPAGDTDDAIGDSHV